MPPVPLPFYAIRQQQSQEEENGRASLALLLPQTIIHHPSSTYTTALTLGAPTSTPTSRPATAALTRRGPADSSSASGPIIGAVMGSILGTLVLITIIYKCCVHSRSATYGLPTAQRRRRHRRGSDSSSSSIGSRSRPFVSGHRGGYLERPKRAHTKRRSSVSSYDDDERGSASKPRDRARWSAQPEMRHGMLGFSLRPQREYRDYGHGHGHSHGHGYVHTSDPASRMATKVRCPPESRKWYGHSFPRPAKWNGDD
ncbi:hypothetical protein PVAG01_02744 [Phlyctema vagabunda]|uniref:Uncharacterized protein n=1 Tax=Phlyctema vagabunda TaxID=108571 RepID=A0ABR4PRI5_9HELO